MIRNRHTKTQIGPTTMLPTRSLNTPRSPLEQMYTVSKRISLKYLLF
jgi:hypothetical protein